MVMSKGKWSKQPLLELTVKEEAAKDKGIERVIKETIEEAMTK